MKYIRSAISAPRSPMALGAFLLLSAGDFLMTWKLIAADDSEIAEINPIALAVLERAGWGGLATYKMALVGGIVAIIATIRSRRPRTGESIIVFGCGAQAAVVITSLLLLRNDVKAEPTFQLDRVSVADADDVSLPVGAMGLLANKEVQDELQLDVQVLERVAVCGKQRRELRVFLREGNVGDCLFRFNEQIAHERSLAWSMTSRQRKRLHELTLQMRGSLAFLDGEVSTALQLSDEQITAISDIVGEDYAFTVATPPRRASRTTTVAQLDRLSQIKDRLHGVLNARQRDVWQEMLGTPFQFDASIASEFKFPLPSGVE